MHHIVNRKRLDNSSPFFGYFDPLLLIAACTAIILATHVPYTMGQFSVLE